MEKQIEKINKKVENIAERMEKLKIAEYIDLLRKPKKFIWINFLAGTARGVGMAIGFTLIAALIVYILTQLAVVNIPIIGDYVAEIAKIVQEQL